jgi:hypothetical protein
MAFISILQTIDTTAMRGLNVYRSVALSLLAVGAANATYMTYNMVAGKPYTVSCTRFY